MLNEIFNQIIEIIEQSMLEIREEEFFHGVYVNNRDVRWPIIGLKMKEQIHVLVVELDLIFTRGDTIVVIVDKYFARSKSL